MGNITGHTWGSIVLCGEVNLNKWTIKSEISV